MSVPTGASTAVGPRIRTASVTCSPDRLAVACAVHRSLTTSRRHHRQPGRTPLPRDASERASRPELVRGDQSTARARSDQGSESNRCAVPDYAYAGHAGAAAPPGERAVASSVPRYLLRSARSVREFGYHGSARRGDFGRRRRRRKMLEVGESCATSPPASPDPSASIGCRWEPDRDSLTSNCCDACWRLRIWTMALRRLDTGGREAGASRGTG